MCKKQLNKILNAFDMYLCISIIYFVLTQVHAAASAEAKATPIIATSRITEICHDLLAHVEYFCVKTFYTRVNSR